MSSEISGIQQDLRNGLAVMTDWVAVVETDPGKALAHLTWLGLAMAQKCQELSEHVVDEVEGNAERRFFSLDGGLFRSNGSVVTLSREFFTILSMPTDEDVVR